MKQKKGKSKVSFGRNFLLPFVSGVLGCTVVIGACFGIPSIRNKLLDTSSNTSNSSNLSSQKDMLAKLHYQITQILLFMLLIKYCLQSLELKLNIM